MYDYDNQNELYHFGVKGMHWGVRRYQNKDGSYTAQGRGRYDTGGGSRRSSSSRGGSSSSVRRARLKRAAMIGAGAAAAGLAAYGGYRMYKSGKIPRLPSRSNLRALPGSTYSRAGAASYRARSATSRAGAGIRSAASRAGAGARNAASRARGAASNFASRRRQNGPIGISGPRYTRRQAAGYKARQAASRIGNTGIGRRIRRGVNSAQYNATRIKNEASYRWATRGSRGARSNTIGLPGSTYSRAARAGYGARRAASAAASGARRAGSAAARAAGSPIRAHNRFTDWAVTDTGSRRRNFARGFVYGSAHGAVPVAATVGAAIHQGRKANKRYRNNSGRKRRR